MTKKSFTVRFNQPVENTPEVVILGVTSIVPNLNGFLFFTENSYNYQVDRSDLVKCDGDEMLCGMSIEYSSEESIASYYREWQNNQESFELIDGRE